MMTMKMGPTSPKSRTNRSPETPDHSTLQEANPYISFHALNGFIVPSTLKIPGKLFDMDVVVLIDGSSTNNFI